MPSQTTPVAITHGRLRRGAVFSPQTGKLQSHADCQPVAQPHGGLMVKTRPIPESPSSRPE